VGTTSMRDYCREHPRMMRSRCSMSSTTENGRGLKIEKEKHHTNRR
jgi:hypothetical protein